MFNYTKPTRNLYVILHNKAIKKNKNQYPYEFRGSNRVTISYAKFNEKGKQHIVEMIYEDMMGTEGRYTLHTYRRYRKGVKKYNKWGRVHRYNNSGKKPYKLAEVEISKVGEQIMGRWRAYSKLEKEDWYRQFKPRFERFR